MEITFLDVGQGDSIVIRDKEKTVIVDCCLNNGACPTIEFLKAHSVNHINLIILSHPHSDHYSGFMYLLEYLVEENISVDYFGITCYLSQANIKQLVLHSSKATNDRILLTRILTECRRLRDEIKLIGKIVHLNDDIKDFMLSNVDSRLVFLAPSVKDIEGFTTKNFEFDEDKFSNENANLLSTVILIVDDTNEKVGILTSDCTKSVFRRAIKQTTKINQKDYRDKIKLVQVPHHGSVGNYVVDLWEKISLMNNDVSAVISVGHNNYGHPSDEVVEDLIKNNYKIFATNNLEFLSYVKSTKTSRVNEKTEKAKRTGEKLDSMFPKQVQLASIPLKVGGNLNFDLN